MDEVNAVIGGSGAAGSLLAAKLSQAGKSVVVLEGGPERQASDLYSSQIWARRIKWFGPSTITGGSDPICVNFGSGWGTGGAALHHYAVWLRRHPDDFDMKSRFGQGLDWPISYEDLRPYYDQIQKEVGISGDAKAEVWRPAGDPYPMRRIGRSNKQCSSRKASRNSDYVLRPFHSQSTRSNITAAPLVFMTAGQTHDVPNLFIAGPCLFPTSAAVNPCFTVNAVTLREAHHMIENWSSLS